MRRALLAMVALALAGRPTLAEDDDSIWGRALVTPEVKAKRLAYERALRDGDEHTQLAAGEANLPERARLVKRAIDSYREAVKRLPTEAEAHYRLGTVQHVFIIACETKLAQSLTCKPNDLKVMRDIVTHWQRFTDLAPLDPRGDQLLFSRAIMRTKLGTKADWQAAIADYEAIVDRREDEPEMLATLAVATSLANLAETYMMMGQMEDAVGAYLRAVNHPKFPNSGGTWLGLAVALDRHGERAKARAIIANLGLQAFEKFKDDVNSGDTFFVPHGEENYYYALAEEALGMPEQAIVHYDLFIRSGAHPQFQQRAKENRDQLRKKGVKSPPPVRDRPTLERPWRRP